jgi:uncharacterized membrane protein
VDRGVTLERQPPEPEETAFDYARTVALSDGVFAIALTLLVLTLTTPALAPGHEGELASRLGDRLETFETYALSFAVIALLWVRHHGFFRGLARIDGRLTVLNLGYLALVAFVPYPTRVLGLYGDQPVAVIIYAGTIGIVGMIAGVMRRHALSADLLTDDGRRHLERREHWAIVPVIFLVSIPVALVSTTAAIVMWCLMIPLVRLAQR